MEITDYFRLFRKRLWIIVLAALLLGGATYQIYSSREPVYRAHTTIAIGTYIRSPNPDSREIETASDLAQTYAELARSYNVLQGTVEALDLPFSANALRGKIVARILPNTSLLVLEVTANDPELTAGIANEVARQLIIQSPTNLTPEQQTQIELAEAQIAELSALLETFREEYDQLDTELLAAQDPEEINRLKIRRDVVVEQINQLSANIAQYSGNITYLQQRRNSLDIVEVAQIPTSPINIATWKITLVGAGLGAALVMGAVLVIEYLRNTFETSNEVTQVLGLPVLGVITRFAHSATDRSQLLIADHGCERFTIEAYQTLQTNLQLTANERCKSVYLITSPGPGEGKTVTAANLAISMTKADLRVVLVDGDLRRPQIHETFGVDNAVGLTTFLTADPSDDNPDFKNSDECKNGLAYLIQETAIPGLSVISSGLQCEHPNEMLGSSQLTHFFEMLRNAPDIDVVVIDSPPCLLVPDGFRLAEVANAQIILILEAGHTQRSIALKAKERFALVGKDISGIVLNKIGRSEEDYYGYRRSYQYYDSGLKTRSFLLKSSVFSRVFAKRH